MYNHLSSIINFLQDILRIFMSRDNTRNNHVNRERKTNYIFNMIWNNTDIKHDTCCSNNLFQICWHNIKQDCYHALYVLLEQHYSHLLVHQPWTVPFQQTSTTLLTTMFHRVQHNTVHACSEQHCSLRLLTTCNRLSIFTRVSATVIWDSLRAMTIFVFHRLVMNF